MSSFPSWASAPTSATTNNPLLRATPLTNQAIYEQRRGMTPASGTYTSSMRNSITNSSSLPPQSPSQEQTNFDRSTVTFGNPGSNGVSSTPNRNNYDSSSTSPSSSRRPSVSQDEGTHHNNFVPRDSRESYYYSPQQHQQFRDPYLQTNVSPNSSSAPNSPNSNNNQERMRNYMQRPAMESGIVTSPSPASSPTTRQQQQQQQQEQNNSNSTSPNSYTSTQPPLTAYHAHPQQQQFHSSPPVSSLSRMNQHLHQQQQTQQQHYQNNIHDYQNLNSSPSDRIYQLAQSRSNFSTEPSRSTGNQRDQFSDRSNAANERRSSAERLIAEVMMRHGHLLSDDERRSSEFSGMVAAQHNNNNFSKASTSSPTIVGNAQRFGSSSPSPSTAVHHNITSPQQLQRSGFAPSTIQKIVHLSHALEQGKETVKESDEKASRIRSDFISQVSQVQDQIEKMHQQMENWKKQIQDLSPLRVRGSQFSYEPRNQRDSFDDDDDDDDDAGNRNNHHVNNSRSGSVLGLHSQPKFGSYHHVGNGDRSAPHVHDLPMTVNFDEI